MCIVIVLRLLVVRLCSVRFSGLDVVWLAHFIPLPFNNQCLTPEARFRAEILLIRLFPFRGAFFFLLQSAHVNNGKMILSRNDIESKHHMTKIGRGNDSLKFMAGNQLK